MDRYVLCNDGTRIYFKLSYPDATARCETCGGLGTGEEGAMGRVVDAHAASHQGKHSVI